MVRGSVSHHSSPCYLLTLPVAMSLSAGARSLPSGSFRKPDPGTPARLRGTHAPAEHPRPSRDEDSRRVHLGSSSLSSGGTLPSFSGLTTSLMALMLPSATSMLTTLWGLPSPK